jgi:hypothetical protein
VAGNVYFDLTRAFNDRGPVVALASGQAVVYYRIAIMSKDGDWVIRETAEACARVLDVLAQRGAFYRPGAPLDPRWLAGGWSSHFEFADEKNRRVRCDFFSRPPRVPTTAIDRLFTLASDPLLVVDVESLIRMKQTQRAKDYAVIGELATRLPPALELLVTTDPDRLLELAPRGGAGVRRPACGRRRAATAMRRPRAGAGRAAVGCCPPACLRAEALPGSVQPPGIRGAASPARSRHGHRPRRTSPSESDRRPRSSRCRC